MKNRDVFMVSEYYINRCMQLAQKGFGRVSPNPMVGAVIVCDGKIIGEGYHEEYGGPHAEVNAISSVNDDELLKRSTLYVSLEPCCHYGKTPPCADLIIKKQIPKVVVCNRDPFPAVDGKGIEKLIDAGVDVEYGVMEADGRWLNRRFFTYHEQHRPYIFLKWAETRDGFIDKLRMGEIERPLRVSNDLSSIAMHEFRSGETAILVGPNTAVMDNPSLTVRHANGKQPVRILLDRDLRVPADLNLYDGTVPTIVITKEPCDEQRENVKYVVCDFRPDGRVDFSSLLRVLYEQKIESLIVEGGRLLLQSFIDEGVWDEIRLEINHALVIGNGVAAPDFSKWKTQVQRYSFQSFGDNDVSFFRRKKYLNAI